MKRSRSLSRLRPAYVHYGAFEEFVRKYGAQGAPDNVTSILSEFPETVQYHLRSSVRALLLIDEHNEATGWLKQLAASEGEERQRIFRDILIGAYPYLFGLEAGVFDPATAANEQLEERFESVDVTAPTMLERCIRFLRHAMKDAGLVVGKRRHITTQSTGASTLPPLPPYDASWPDDIKRLWFEMRLFETRGEDSR